MNSKATMPGSQDEPNLNRLVNRVQELLALIEEQMEVIAELSDYLEFEVQQRLASKPSEASQRGNQ